MERCPEVIVTSQNRNWCGTSSSRAGVLSVLIGDAKKEQKARPALSGADAARDLRCECAEANAIAFLFEKKDGAWKAVPVEKFGTEPYLFDGVLVANMLSYVSCCKTDAEQQAYLKEAGVAIDGQLIDVE